DGRAVIIRLVAGWVVALRRRTVPQGWHRLRPGDRQSAAPTQAGHLGRPVVSTGAPRAAVRLGASPPLATSTSVQPTQRRRRQTSPWPHRRKRGRSIPRRMLLPARLFETGRAERRSPPRAASELL